MSFYKALFLLLWGGKNVVMMPVLRIMFKITVPLKTAVFKNSFPKVWKYFYNNVEKQLASKLCGWHFALFLLISLIDGLAKGEA